MKQVLTIIFTGLLFGGYGQDTPPPPPPRPVQQVEAVQEESPVSTQDAEEVEEEPKLNFSDVFGAGRSNSGVGSGEGMGEGIGGPNMGGGIGDGRGRQVIGAPELINLNNKWVGYVMVEFIIDRNGKTISTKVLHPHPKTTITLLSSEKTFIEQDCKKKFKFTPSSTAKEKDRIFKRLQYIKI